MSEQRDATDGATPSPQNLAGRLRGNAAFLASNYNDLSDSEAQVIVRALESAADHVEAYLASVPSEIAEFELAKKVIAWANNSLFGSHGYFLSDCGGPPEEHHLDMPIERLKADCNRWYNAAAPYSTPEALKEALSAPSATPCSADAILEQCAGICEQRASEWDSSVREGSEQRAYEETVLLEVAARIRSLKGAL